MMKGTDSGFGKEEHSLIRQHLQEPPRSNSINQRTSAVNKHPSQCFQEHSHSHSVRMLLPNMCAVKGTGIEAQPQRTAAGNIESIEPSQVPKIPFVLCCEGGLLLSQVLLQTP